MSRPIPTFADWLALDDSQRADHLASWNCYAGEGEPLVKAIADSFRSEYGHIRNLTITAPGIYHGGEWVIGASHPLVFDCRLLPHQYLGIRVVRTVANPLPEEFQGQEHPKGYVWSPNNFERFVDRCGDDIRRELGNPSMSRSEMLEALLGIPFEAHVAHCREWAKKGVIPPFE